MGKESENDIILNSAEASFFNYIGERFDDVEIANFRAALQMNDEQRLERIHELTERIGGYAIAPEKATPGTKKAWEVLDDFSVSKSQFLYDNGLTIVVRGSAVFDDPGYFRFNLCVLGNKDDESIQMTIEDDWREELEPIWHGIRPVDHPSFGIYGLISYVNFENLETQAKALKENWKGYVEEGDFDILTDIMDASSVLVGKYLYTSDEETDNLKNRYLEIVQQSPLLSSLAIAALEDIVIERETRRAGVADHQTGEDEMKRRKIFGDDDII